MSHDRTAFRAQAVPIAQAAALLMISAERLRQLQASGHVPRAGRGMVPLAGAIQGYVRFLLADERRTARSAADSRVTDMRAEELALRVDERRRALDERAGAEAMAAIDDVAGRLRSDIEAIPARRVKDLALRRELERDFEDAFDAAAQRAGAAAAREAIRGPR